MVILTEQNINQETLGQYDLQYVYDQAPGIVRQKRGRGFAFYDASGSLIKCKKERQRLINIAVPPTYEDVWYCPVSNGHLQATGHDSNLKKQYFYHSNWERLRQSTKFNGMVEFAENLPRLRRYLGNYFDPKDLSKNSVISMMIRILDKTGMRIGNDQDRSSNKTYGLTTLEKKHIETDDSGKVHFEYTGKGMVDLEKTLQDKRLSMAIQNCVEIPGQRVFEYKDQNGNIHDIDSSDINTFIKTHLGEKFSAKDFRTWRFSCLFFEKFLKYEDQQDTLTLKALLEDLSEDTGNTPSVLQSSYVHPGLIDMARNKNFEIIKNSQPEKSGLRLSENQLLGYLHSKHASEFHS